MWSPDSSEKDTAGRMDGSILLENEIIFLDTLGSVAGIAAVLDGERRIVYANNNFLSLIGLGGLEQVLGKRPGEAVGCANASAPSGCGTSEACEFCGAVNAITESQKTGQRSVREARINTVNGVMKSWDLRVASVPVRIRDRMLYLFTLEDISNLKRRESLEKTFFHDLLNSAGNLSGMIALLKEEKDPDRTAEFLRISESTLNDIIDEILMHRQLREAEDGDLVVKRESVSVADELLAAVSKISGNTVADQRHISVSDSTGNMTIETDRLLLRRILNNLIKNALEATPEDGTVETTVSCDGENVFFCVKNDQLMSPEIIFQVFQRSFSTKGKGRGIGAYGAKLLAENYLGGKLNCHSAPETGTVFTVSLPYKTAGIN